MRPIEPTTLGRIYRLHAAALRLYARQWPGAAEDLVQDAFVRLAQQSPTPDRPLPWLYSVVRNAAMDGFRTSNRRRQREKRVSAPEAWFSSADERLDAELATSRLSELELEFREVVVARIWGGLTFEEVAGLVGCSLATAQRRYQAGLDQLRERLERSCTQTTVAPTT